MIDREEIANAIEQLELSETSWNVIERLAALYTVKQNLMNDTGYSYAPPPVERIEVTDIESDFGEVIKGKPTNDVLMVIDELMDALRILQPKMYDSVIQKLAMI